MSELVICIALGDPALRAFIANETAGLGLRIVEPDGLAGETESIALVIADSTRSDVARALGNASTGAQVIYLGQATDKGAPRWDFILDQDAHLGDLRSACEAALEAYGRRIAFREDVHRRKSAIGTIVSGCFVIRTLDEARNLATMLALACPHPDLTAVGLQELLINAVEHGNLEIDGAMKQRLLLEGRWREEVDRRLEDPAFRSRIVVVTFDRKRQRIEIGIEDEGGGFDFAKLTDPEMAGERLHGRGIMLAREIAFSEIAYQGCGNSVLAWIDVST
jgi:sigma-B regulation protein RsbU (phosphoserine phosphatase)